MFELTEVTADTEPWTVLRVCAYCSARQSWTACKRRSIRGKSVCVVGVWGSVWMPISFSLLFFLSCKCLHPRLDRTKRTRTHTIVAAAVVSFYSLSLSSLFFLRFFFILFLDEPKHTHTYTTDSIEYIYITPNDSCSCSILFVRFVVSSGSFFFYSKWKYHYRKVQKKEHAMIWQTADASMSSLHVLRVRESEIEREREDGLYITLVVDYDMHVSVRTPYSNDAQRLTYRIYERYLHTLSISSIGKSMSSSWWSSSRAIPIRKMISMPYVKEILYIWYQFTQ
jgi:hypothetical protein